MSQVSNQNKALKILPKHHESIFDMPLSKYIYIRTYIYTFIYRDLEIFVIKKKFFMGGQIHENLSHKIILTLIIS